MKRFLKTIALFMVVILCLGAVATLFDSGSAEEPTGPGIEEPEDPNGEIPEDPENPEENETPEDPDEPECAHVDADDDNLCDKCGESYKDGQDIFGGTVRQTIDFSEGADATFSFAANKYGTKTYENGYVKLYTTEQDVGVTLDNHMSFKVAANGDDIAFADVDYITLDFDVWTDDDFIVPVSFIFYNSLGEKVSMAGVPRICRDSESGRAYMTLFGSESSVLKYFDGTEPMHVTMIIKPDDYRGVFDPTVSIYLDGELAISTCLITESDHISAMRISLAKQEVEANKSVCLDNIQVSTFGDGSGKYNGDIAKAHNTTEMNLTECADSVLFNKNN